MGRSAPAPRPPRRCGPPCGPTRRRCGCCCRTARPSTCGGSTRPVCSRPASPAVNTGWRPSMQMARSSTSTTRTASGRPSATSTSTCSARAATTICTACWALIGARIRVEGTSFAVWAPNAKRCGWWATSTSGTAACIPCARWGRRASGSCSCRGGGGGAGTSSKWSAPTGSCGSRPTPWPSPPRCRPGRPASSPSPRSTGPTASGWCVATAPAPTGRRSPCRSTRCTSGRGARA